MSNLANKSNEQLRYILRDASEAALAMRDHDEAAEAKYLDQVNDALTVLESRRAVEAYGVKGMQSKPWRKVFANEAAWNRWYGKHAGNVEVHGTRWLEWAQ